MRLTVAASASLLCASIMMLDVVGDAATTGISILGGDERNTAASMELAASCGDATGAGTPGGGAPGGSVSIITSGGDSTIASRGGSTKISPGSGVRARCHSSPSGA